MLDPTALLDDWLRPSRLFNEWARLPSVDVEEADNEYLVSVDLPGYKKEDIQVECTDNHVTIAAEHSETETKRRNSRRSYGSFFKSFTLPRGTDTEQISVDYENGVLMVHIPRGEEPRPRRIEIGASGSKQASGNNMNKDSESKTH